MRRIGWRSPPSPPMSPASALSREAARECGREVVMVGRAMDRVVEVANELRLPRRHLPEFRAAENFGYLPRDKVVAMLTGSQGEPRAALARIAQDEHPDIALSTGDRVIFSSRAIPGNEKAVGSIINSLIEQGIEVITDRTELVHVSGHPAPWRTRRRCTSGRVRASPFRPMARPLHLAEHAEVRARRWASPRCVRGQQRHAWCGWRRRRPRSSTACRSAGSTRTATSSSAAASGALPERRKLAFAGIVTRRHRASTNRARSRAIRWWSHGPAEPNRQGRGLDATSSPTWSAICSTACRRPSAAMPKRSRSGPARGARRRRRGLGQEAACHVLVLEV